MPKRRYLPDGKDRRWVEGAEEVNLTDLPDESMRLLLRGVDTLCRWKSAGRAAGRGTDQVEAENLLRALTDAGYVRIRERQNRRGDWEPYQWTTTPRGVEAATTLATDAPVDVEAYLNGDDLDDTIDHRVLTRIRTWLETSNPDPTDMLTRIVVALGEDFRAGHIPRARLVSVRIGGHTKAVNIRAYRDPLEAALNLPLDELVMLHGRSVLAYGPFEYEVEGHTLRGDLSVPWTAFTPETLAKITDFKTEARRILSIENIVAFEEQVRRGLDPGTIAVFTAGFPGAHERNLLHHLIEAGVEEVAHWGDLDLGGLRILRHLQETLPVPVVPYRMEPELVRHLPGIPMNDTEREALRAWLNDPSAPSHDLARALLEHDRKVEQETWFLVSLESVDDH